MINTWDHQVFGGIRVVQSFFYADLCVFVCLYVSRMFFAWLFCEFEFTLKSSAFLFYLYLILVQCYSCNDINRPEDCNSTSTCESGKVKRLREIYWRKRMYVFDVHYLNFLVKKCNFQEGINCFDLIFTPEVYDLTFVLLRFKPKRDIWITFG